VAIGPKGRIGPISPDSAAGFRYHPDEFWKGKAPDKRPGFVVREAPWKSLPALLFPEREMPEREKP
jgi:hypothetical protein